MTSSNCFANGSNQNAGNCITDRSTTRLHHAPGGASSICLGHDDSSSFQERPSSNRFASGANQNAGNCITDRSTTRLHQAPGGASSLCLGAGDSSSFQERPSSNRFASGANQNAGNCITDRSTTRLHHAPGGASSICLGQDEKVGAPNVAKPLNAHAVPEKVPANGFANGNSQNVAPLNAEPHQGFDRSIPSRPATTSANRFASGTNQNAGNVLTDRPTTRLHQAPGGRSSIVLG